MKKIDLKTSKILYGARLYLYTVYICTYNRMLLKFDKRIKEYIKRNLIFHIHNETNIKQNRAILSVSHCRSSITLKDFIS